MSPPSVRTLPAGVWLSVDAARSVALALSTLDNLLRRHRATRMNDDLAQLRQQLIWTFDVDADAHVSELAAPLPGRNDRRGLVDSVTAAQVLGLTPGGVRERARRGQLTATKVGGRWLVDLSQASPSPG